METSITRDEHVGIGHYPNGVYIIYIYMYI